MKRNPKEEKISLEIENVFVKFMNLPFENYYLKIVCELNKIEQDSIRELRRN